MRPAVTHKRKSQTGDWQNADIHSDIYRELGEKKKRQSNSKKTFKIIFLPDFKKRSFENSPQKNPKKRKN